MCADVLPSQVPHPRPHCERCQVPGQCTAIPGVRSADNSSGHWSCQPHGISIAVHMQLGRVGGRGGGDLGTLPINCAAPPAAAAAVRKISAMLLSWQVVVLQFAAIVAHMYSCNPTGQLSCLCTLVLPGGLQTSAMSFQTQPLAMKCFESNRGVESCVTLTGPFPSVFYTHTAYTGASD